MAKQISVFLENKEGRLAHVTRVLAKAGINIRALSVADTSDFGILRIIVNDPDRAYQELKANNFTVSETDVIAVKTPDSPGGLASILDKVSEENLNIEYLYAFVGTTNNEALIIFKVEDIETAQRIFIDKGIKVVSAKELYSL